MDPDEWSLTRRNMKLCWRSTGTTSAQTTLNFSSTKHWAVAETRTKNRNKFWLIDFHINQISNSTFHFNLFGFTSKPPLLVELPRKFKLFVIFYVYFYRYFYCQDRADKTEYQLSAIGGTMGLLTGFSLISAVEILYFILKIGRDFLHDIKRKYFI